LKSSSEAASRRIIVLANLELLWHDRSSMTRILGATVFVAVVLVAPPSAHAYGHGNVISAKADGKYSGHVTVSWQLDTPPQYGDDVYSVVYLWVGPPTTWLPLDGLPHVGHSYKITTGASLATNSFTTPEAYPPGSYAVSILVNDKFHSDTYYQGCSPASARSGPWLCSINDWSFPAAFRIDKPKVCRKELVRKGYFTRRLIGGHSTRIWHKPLYRTHCP
jgi:hypothetical protein